MFNLEKNRALLIGLVKLVLMQVLVLISTNAAQANDDCKFDGLFYDIKLLSVALKEGYEINKQAKKTFLFGICENHAVLELDNEELIVFNLLEEIGKTVKLVGRTDKELGMLRKDLSSNEYWNAVLTNFSENLPITKSSEIKAIWHNSTPNLLIHSPRKNDAFIINRDNRTRVLNFVTSRTNEMKYLKFLIDLADRLQGSNSLIKVAGDNGFIVSRDNTRRFISYPDNRQLEVCSLEEIVGRAKKFPKGVSMNSFSIDPESDRRLLISLANHTHRTKYSSLSFGCIQ